jgi:predicted alternative tryptophan synthase beta-subunit
MKQSPTKNLKIGERLHRRLKTDAAALGVGVREAVEEAVVKWLDLSMFKRGSRIRKSVSNQNHKGKERGN